MQAAAEGQSSGVQKNQHGRSAPVCRETFSMFLHVLSPVSAWGWGGRGHLFRRTRVLWHSFCMYYYWFGKSTGSPEASGFLAVSLFLSEVRSVVPGRKTGPTPSQEPSDETDPDRSASQGRVRCERRDSRLPGDDPEAGGDRRGLVVCGLQEGREHGPGRFKRTFRNASRCGSRGLREVRRKRRVPDVGEGGLHFGSSPALRMPAGGSAPHRAQSRCGAVPPVVPQAVGDYRRPGPTTPQPLLCRRRAFHQRHACCQTSRRRSVEQTITPSAYKDFNSRDRN